MPYRIEYSSSARAGCKGELKMSGRNKIAKGALRLGTVVEIQGKQSFQWRHWGCTTPKILSNIKEAHPEPTDLDGYEDLTDEDKAKIVKAWQEGHVDPADIPETQAQPGDEPPEKK
ncbi:hypothetical protein DFP72DRAFT_808558, partial [Ephemerocybe angulata]